MAIFITWIALSFVAGAIANNKGRSAVGFFFLSLFLSPLIGILTALVSKSDLKAIEARHVEDGTMRKCPFCAELVKAEATVCRYCGKDLPKSEAIQKPTPATVRPSPMDRKSKLLLAGLVVVFVGVLSALRFGQEDAIDAIVLTVHKTTTGVTVSHDGNSDRSGCVVHLHNGGTIAMPPLRPHQATAVPMMSEEPASVQCGRTTARV
jgi:hypothetical protein